jgi:multidrug efflux pump subunit AcrB
MSRLFLAALALLPACSAAFGAGPLPAITVEASYPGASARVVADTVAAPIEKQLKGIDKGLHVWSRCTDEGKCVVTVTFKRGTKLALAEVQARNRVALALPTLPDVVKAGNVTVREAPDQPLLIVTLVSPGGKRDALFLSNYAALQFQDELARVPGVCAVSCLGQHDHSLRVWPDPDRLAAHRVKPDDVFKAVDRYRAEVAKGEIGAPPVPPVGPFGGPRLDPRKVANLVVKKVAGGRDVKVRDVARVEPGLPGEGFASLDGQPAAAVVIYRRHNARPGELSAALKKVLAKLRTKLPAGLAVGATIDFAQGLEGKKGAPEYLLVDVALPAGASSERVFKALERCAAVAGGTKGVRHVLALSECPFGHLREGPCLLVSLAPAGKGRAKREEVLANVRRRLMVEVPEARTGARDLSSPGGPPLAVAVSGPDAARVRELTRTLAARLSRSPKVRSVWAEADLTPPKQIVVDIDRARLKAKGVSLGDVLNSLKVYLGGAYVRDVNRFGRTWSVVASGGPGKSVADLKELMVRDARGEMVPLTALASIQEVEAVGALYRLDGRPAAEITGDLIPGVSPADARRLCEEEAEAARRKLRLPATYRLTWLGEAAAK